MFASHNIMKWLAIAALVACGARLRGAEQAAAPAKTEMMIPKSVFVNDSDTGKDPFFPLSTRRKDAVPRAVAAATNAAPARAVAFDCLKLKGISGTKTQPLALVNSTTFTVGESAEIKCGGQILKVKCVEIREDSILIEIPCGGEVRELKLRKGI
jgi:hypothetical protein